MDAFFNEDQRLAQRAALVVVFVARENGELLQPQVSKLLNNIIRNKNTGQVRNSLRVLQYLTIEEKHHAALMNSCFNFLQAPSTPTAVKAFSMTILHNLSKKYAEILPELRLILEEQFENGSPGCKARAKKILKQ